MRFNIGEKFEPNPSAKDYLLALSQFPIYTRLLDPSNKSYEKIYIWLLDNEKRLLDEDASFPAVRDIAKECGIEPSKVTKHLKAIYNEIHQLNNDFPDKFVGENQKLCLMTFKYMDNYNSFNLGLNIIPKVGENFIFPFIKPQSGGDYFVIQRIYHSIENGKQSINIYLGTDQPILYLQLLKEKAYLNRAISSMDYIGSIDSELQKRLVEMYKNL